MTRPTDDDSMVKALFGGSVGSGGRWRCLARGGHLLLLVRDGAPGTALQLYQPQRTLARLFRGFLAIAWRAGAPRLLKTVMLDVHEGSPLSALKHETHMEPQAILLGNPEQGTRRALVLTSDPRGNSFVTKVGTHPKAVEAIRREQGFLTKIGGGYPAVLRCESALDGDSWAAFTVRNLRGKAVGIRDHAEILGILDKWLDKGGRKPLQEFSRWQEVVAGWTDSESLNQLRSAGRNICVTATLAHGDLAPWNLLRDERGGIFAIDWEDGDDCGIPGWDWVHFVYQVATLVDRKTASETAARLVSVVQSPESRTYLGKAGWTGSENWLLMTYLSAAQPSERSFRRDVLGHVMRLYKR